MLPADPSAPTTMSKLASLFLLPTLLLLGACGSSEDADNTHTHADGTTHSHDENPGAFVVPESGNVFFVEPADGATVSSPVKVVMGVEDVEVRAAGEIVPNTGHHHIIINGDFIPTETIVPDDENHLHYGAAQTETELELEPGEYTLTMQLADGIHRSYGEKFSAQIKITVE